MSKPPLKSTYVTEDGVTLGEGDHAYNYYSMKPGRIGRAVGVGPGFDGWFDFHHDDGSTISLNGQRICSDEMAKDKGFPNAN